MVLEGTYATSGVNIYYVHRKIRVGQIRGHSTTTLTGGGVRGRFNKKYTVVHFGRGVSFECPLSTESEII